MKSIYTRGMQKNRAIVLIGVKHCGKSTLGKAISEKVGVPFVDVDDEIQIVTGKSPREVYQAGGPQKFMEAETFACKNISEKFKNQGIVIATGGGICDNPEAMNLLVSLGPMVMINASIKLIVDRVFNKVTLNQNGTWEGLPAYVLRKNPLTVDEAKEIFKEIMTERIENYKKLADIIFEPEKGTIEQNVNRLLEKI